MNPFRISAPLIGAAFAIATHAADRPKLAAEKWSAGINVPDPVACSVDDQGRVFVTSTERRKVGDLDIREWTDWIPDDQSLQSVEDKRAFFHRTLAPGLKPEGPLKDANGDGSIDWKDLTVPTERIFRLVDSNGDGKAGQITTFAEDFNTEVTGIAAGVMAWDGDVYATIAPDVWRMKDTDGDGKSDTRESIAHGFGIHIAYAGHDMHGLRIGPDGRIYWSIGDKGVNVTTKEGKNFFYPNQGAVLRCEPDGSNFEVFAHGLRNVQEVAFNELGDLFGVDNDADKPGEKERLVFIAEGSDSGWRCGFQYMTGDWNPWLDEARWQPENEAQPWFITPPVANSHDGPSGFVFNPGAALAEAWRGWFFLDQFPSGNMNALRLEADGAAWKLAEDVKVSSGIMGVGMSWGPDGRLFFTDWGGGYPLNQKGAVWTLDVPEADRDPLRDEVRARLHEGFGKLGDAALLALLAHADVRLRGGAQFQLARTGKWDALKSAAMKAETPPIARLHAVWGLGQGLRRGKWNEPKALRALLADADAEVRAQTAKIAGEGPDDEALAADLAKLISDPQPRVRFHAALAAGRKKIPAAAAPLLSAIAAHGDGEPWTRHALVTGLAGCASDDELARAAGDANAAVRRASLLALARRHSPAVAGFLKDSDPRFAAEAALAIHDDEGIPEALPQLAEWLPAAPDNAPEGALRRALNANLQLGTPEAANRVAKYALEEKANPRARAEALALLATWNAPPVLDRVDGRHRLLPPRPIAPIREALDGFTGDFLSIEQPALRAAALGTILKLGLPVPPVLAAGIASDEQVPTRVRIEALRLIAAQKPAPARLRPLLDGWLGASGKKTPPALRAEALRTLAGIDPAGAFKAAQLVFKTGAVEEKQAAWNVLGRLGTPEADRMIVNALDHYAEVPRPLKLDLLAAAERRAERSFDVANAVGRYQSAYTSNLALNAYAMCIEGGDPEAGRAIALGNIAANCTACHRFEGAAGSEVGPPLDGIASRASRGYMLESLVAPNAQIVAGYGIATVKKKDGESVTGAALGSDEESVRIRTPEGSAIEIPRAEVARETRPVSAMPPLGALLNKFEIRDLVAYLATLENPSKKKKEKTKKAE